VGDDLDQAVTRKLADLEGRSNGAGGSDPESNASEEDDDNNDHNDGSSKTEPSDEDGSLSGYSSSSAQPALVKRAQANHSPVVFHLFARTERRVYAGRLGRF
jgi:hypothetical protein